jgi:hypothetical protein
MERSISQLLFTYLPERTVDWEDGLAIVRLGAVRLLSAWEDDRKTAVLEEIAEELHAWKQSRGNVDPHFPDPIREAGRFTVGTPASIEASVLETALVCKRCDRLHFDRYAGASRKSRSLTCRHCQTKSLRQFPFVFVHGCGELEPVTMWVPGARPTGEATFEPTRFPLKCQTCGDKSDPALPARSDRVKDMHVVCLSCKKVIADRLTARCARCVKAINRQKAQAVTGAQTGDREATFVTRILMRATRYSASNAYYPRTLSLLRLDQPASALAGDPELEQLQRMLPASVRPEGAANEADILKALSQRMAEAIASGQKDEVDRVRELVVRTMTGTAEVPQKSAEPTHKPLRAPDLHRAIRESVAFQSSMQSAPALKLAAESGGPTALITEPLGKKLRELGIAGMRVVYDLPVISAAYGYTRRSFEPTYQELAETDLPTEIRTFGVIDEFAARDLGRPGAHGTVPVLAREGRHQGIFISLNPDRVLAWLERNDVPVPTSDEPPIARILRALEPVDRYHDTIWQLNARRYVFGLLHSLSHAAMRAATRYAGLERTSLSEHLFLPLLGAVIYDNAIDFQLGGLEALARNYLGSFIEALEDDAMACLYDTECIDHRGACHGCLHSPEISCRVFNHGLSRAFLIGGHVPWVDVSRDERIVGYWSPDPP